MVQIQRLEGFYWVASTGGFTRAARAFPYPITQPAVHQQVRKLEQELAVTLLERVGKDRMQLTPAGAHLFRFIEPFFRDLPAVVRALQSQAYGGRLRIHAEPLMLRHLLPAWLKRLQRRRADVAIELQELAEADVGLLRSGAADVLVAYLPDPPDDIAAMRIATLYPFLVIPRDHPLAAKPRLGIGDLAGEPFIAYHEHLLPHRLQLEALRAHGVQPPEVVTTSSADSILGLVESGLGFSLVPSLSSTGPRSRGLVARPLRTPKVEFPVVAAWRKNAPENPILDAALECAPSP